MFKRTAWTWMDIKVVLMTRTSMVSMSVATLSGVLASVLFILDNEKYFNMRFLAPWLPELLVFNGFMVFTSLVASFRTAHALVRYTDAAAQLHKMLALWFDSSSTLFAFCRASSASQAKIDRFQHTLVRLVSALNAMCFEELTIRSKSDDERLPSNAFKFEVIDLHALDDYTQDAILGNEFGPEYIFQCVQTLTVKAMSDDSDGTDPVLSIAPPILTRSFQEMGSGFLAYHEARKLTTIPLPSVYAYITYTILLAEAIFAPFTLASSTRGWLSSFVFTWFATFLLWFLNGMADTLNNPFQKQANTLDMAAMQEELNLMLAQLLTQYRNPLPNISDVYFGRLLQDSADPTICIGQHSLPGWKHDAQVQRHRLSASLNASKVCLYHCSSARLSESGVTMAEISSRRCVRPERERRGSGSYALSEEMGIKDIITLDGTSRWNALETEPRGNARFSSSEPLNGAQGLVLSQRLTQQGSSSAGSKAEADGSLSQASTRVLGGGRAPSLEEAAAAAPPAAASGAAAPGPGGPGSAAEARVAASAQGAGTSGPEPPSPPRAA